MREVAGTTAGQSEFLVGHRPVVRFGEVLELAGRCLHDAGRVVVLAVFAQRRPHPQPCASPVAAREPVVDGEGLVVAGGDFQLAGHLGDDCERQIELGDAAGDIELAEDRTGTGVGVLGRERAQGDALVAFEVAE
ncbi:hypothetical protein [Streptomyces tailanensis]|uniref:hypothetical protein n=1 Tax=Streptomyces tailanensis TaxID=2569858 RepID=UPI00155B1885